MTALTGQRCQLDGCGERYEHPVHDHYTAAEYRTWAGKHTHAFVAPPVAPRDTAATAGVLIPVNAESPVSVSDAGFSSTVSIVEQEAPRAEPPKCEWCDGTGCAHCGWTGLDADTLDRRNAEFRALQETTTPQTVWLIERSQEEEQSPPLWWRRASTPAGLYEWTETANAATPFATREAAQAQLDELSGIPRIHAPFGHVTEHVFPGAESLAKLLDCHESTHRALIVDPTPDHYKRFMETRRILTECYARQARTVDVLREAATEMIAAEDAKRSWLCGNGDQSHNAAFELDKRRMLAIKGLRAALTEAK